ncbi:MAG: rhodanese-like domain-containing protein [Spirochaetia bacterium]|jgi:rhodanese-related sulfurtransferase|nr:rhodanese-like domain-containing protein [Spirochaetia bacterium]
MKNKPFAQSKTRSVSGTLNRAARVLTADMDAESFNYTVYRGDCITFTAMSDNPLKLQIPSLDVDTSIPFPSDIPYIKMNNTGKIEITLSGKPGIINVIDFSDSSYHETNAMGADAFIKNIKPLILDVRRKEEYDSSHIENSMLIPVQSLSDELDKLAKYKNENILIYCAAGNRSTVASKILIDAGFTNIHNMRYGIGEWIQKELPVVNE